MPKPILVRNHRRIAEVLAGERAISGCAGLATAGIAARTLDNITRSIADVFAQSSTAFNRERFYEIAGLPSLRSPELCAVCDSELQPTQDDPDNYVHSDENHEDHRPVRKIAS